jgi:AbrB family looped-hinge helix DNA binding protein
MCQAKLTTRGRITIPKNLRDAMRLRAGDRIHFVEAAEGTFTVVAATRDVRELKGLIPKPLRPVAVNDMSRPRRRA